LGISTAKLWLRETGSRSFQFQIFKLEHGNLQKTAGKNAYPPLLKTFLKPFILLGKTSVNSTCPARTKEETPRYYAPCQATSRYRFNCSHTIRSRLDYLDFCGLVAYCAIRLPSINLVR
jgi:hypothetical protein